jgi:uncharacterized membrane protein YhaH (DUF805 family)
MQRLTEFSLQGILSRRGFWWRQLLVLPVAMIIVLHLGTGILNLVGAVLLTAWLVSVWGRRLHDRGLSAWWLLIVMIPVAGALWLWWQCGVCASAVAADSDSAARPDYLTVGG